MTLTASRPHISPTKRCAITLLARSRQSKQWQDCLGAFNDVTETGINARIREEEIRELEGLFRQIYRRDGRANSLNKAKSFKELKVKDLSNIEELFVSN